jgi:hypothetical protein
MERFKGQAMGARSRQPGSLVKPPHREHRQAGSQMGQTICSYRKVEAKRIPLSDPQVVVVVEWQGA